MDGSASAEYNSRGGFRRNLGLVKEFAREFLMSPDDARFGLVVFASEAGVEFTFDSHNTRDSLIADIDSIKFPGTATYLGVGLRLANNDLFTKARSDAKQILVVITDALSHDDIKTPSKAIKDKGVEIFSVGVGIRQDDEILEEIASAPKADHVFSTPKHANLYDVLRAIKKKICTGKRISSFVEDCAA